MPFSTEITNIKSEINSGLAASQYTAKDLVYVSKAIEALANAETTAGVFDTVTVSSILYVGSGAAGFGSSLTNPIGVFTINNNDYAQVAIKNSSSGGSASSDFLAYANNGSDETGWIDMGITSSTFTDPSFTITGANDGYIFMSAPQGTSGHGNLVLATDGTGTQNRIVFAAGGLSSNNTQMTIIPNTRVHVEIATQSTSPTTGALTVAGGLGVSGNVNVQGNVAIQGTITFGGAGTTVETANLSVTDPLLFVGKSNAADILDLGLIGEYKVGANTKYAGLVRDASDGIIKAFRDASTKPTSTVNFAEAGLAYADVKVGGFTADSITVGNVSNTEFGYLDGVTSAIQTQLNTKAVYPTQTGNSGNFLTTDGTTTSWSAVYPSQTGNSGKYLTTNGSVTSWATVDALPSQTNNSGKYLTTNGTSASWATITTDPLPDVFMMMGA